VEERISRTHPSHLASIAVDERTRLQEEDLEIQQSTLESEEAGSLLRNSRREWNQQPGELQQTCQERGEDFDGGNQGQI